MTTFSTRQNFSPPSPVLKPRGVYYQSDGKGRDSYIETNSGGLNGFANLLKPSEAFKKSLRADFSKQSYAQLGREIPSIAPLSCRRTLDVNKSVEDVSLRRSVNFAKSVDPFMASQVSFNDKFRATQNAWRRYQIDSDSKLAEPKQRRPTKEFLIRKQPSSHMRKTPRKA